MSTKVSSTSTPLPLVLVEWEDALLSQEQVKITDVKEELSLNIRLGFLLKITRKNLVLAHEWVPRSGEVREIITIPYGWVKKLVFLEEGDALQKRRATSKISCNVKERRNQRKNRPRVRPGK